MLACFRACTDGTSWLAVLIVVLPSLVTALTRYPKAAGALAVAQGVLDRLSVLTHHDAPGTLKLPLLRSVPRG